MQDELIELQSKLAFQEQTLNELNNALLSQQQQIDRLHMQIKSYEERLSEVENASPSNGQGQDEKPPHY
jgi:SlyX protein